MYVCRECFVPATADDKQMITRNILQLSHSIETPAS